MVLFLIILRTTPSPSATLFFLSTQQFPLVFLLNFSSVNWYVQDSPLILSRQNCSKGNHFAPPLWQLQNDMKRGTSTSSNGSDFIPNINGWDDVLMLERNHWNQHKINENILVSSFPLFDCKTAEIYTLELVHWIFPK